MENKYVPLTGAVKIPVVALYALPMLTGTSLKVTTFTWGKAMLMLRKAWKATSVVEPAMMS
ncbi:hypothetical protein DPMN_099131 [Dreissena polymorpha]|uniref:Uncharacterized protein n=1 Tax=Dreissena polymorpha TaxID=45954 RepID=A0A9D4LGJ6_DREPO|nr:hypothetical protein DPMN_099131 [Dreissena polymorpha]